MGVYDRGLCKPIAETLKLLGTKSALVVHGSGLDEIATHDETTACMLKDREITELTLTPEELGIARHSLIDLKGGDPAQNAKALTQILSGDASEALLDVVAVNTGPLLFLAGLAPCMKTGVQTAKTILTKGQALSRLTRFIEATTRVKKAA
jgi:anthranilate phosphoribosyltransferase